MFFELCPVVGDLAEEFDFLQMCHPTVEKYKQGNRLCLQLLADRIIRTLVLGIKGIGFEELLCIPIKIRQQLIEKLCQRSL